MAFPTLTVLDDFAQAAAHDFDAVLLVGDFNQPLPGDFSAHVKRAKRLDKRVGSTALLVPSEVPGGRLICAPTGALDTDYADVRQVAEAAGVAAKIAQQAGALKPLLVVFGMPSAGSFAQAEAVAYWGVCQALYQPLEAREAHGEDQLEPITSMGLVANVDGDWLMAVEAGKRLARDLCGTEPERMSAINFARYLQQAFAQSPVQVTVIDDMAQLRREYPLLMATWLG
jgi:leucyl aminopeptidase